MPNHRDRWRHGQSPPTDIFQKPQTASLLFAALFFFDGFRGYPLSNLEGYSRKLLKHRGKISEYYPFRPEFCKKQREISASVGKWCAIRAPPQKSEAGPNNFQIFGGYIMKTQCPYKNFSINYFLFGNNSVALPSTIPAKELWKGVNA